jgi:class 3 adenylate cyclase
MLTTRLEAIMFTNIAGYSQLMENDEDRTIELLQTHNEIVFPVIEADDGQVVSAIGDGLLVVFPSVRKAVECAVTIHTRVATHNEDALEDERFKLRIGIHLGEVQHDETRIYGTGVNVAARVQPFALPGGICISDDVYRHVERSIPQSITSIGVQTLKNISRQYELYRVITGYEDATQDVGAVEDTTSPGTEVSAVPAKPSGELDEIKEKILSEIGKWSEKSRSGGDSDRDGTGAQVGSKVFGLVEHIMDRAIGKWDTMPAEKKSDIIEKIKTGFDKSAKKKDEEKKSSIAGEIIWGATATLGLGIWYSQTGSVWMIVVGVLVGVFPLISGIQKLIKRLIRKKSERETKPKTLEGEVLKAARELGGKVTVVQIAAEIERPLDEVQTALDIMTSKGYVSQEILESGVIRYDFPALISDSDDTDPIE